MKSNLPFLGQWSKGISGLLAAVAFSASSSAEVTWQRTPDSIACKLEGESLWQFNFSTNQGKPHFHPLRLRGGESLTTLKPGDHLWHYGLWFSWKYINGVNYWEEDKTGHAAGATRWDPPKIATNPDGSAKIEMSLRYVSPSNQIMMTEERSIRVSAPGDGGAVTIDWVGTFKAGKDALLLDRTHMPGEPQGAINGGYAGFSLRAAQLPAACQFVTAEGPVEKFESDRARPNSKAAACNIIQDNHTNGISIFSNVSNTGGTSPWYMINSKSMRWFSPALLAPAPRKVNPQETFVWKFRVQTKPGGWTPQMLQTASDTYNSSSGR